MANIDLAIRRMAARETTSNSVAQVLVAKKRAELAAAAQQQSPFASTNTRLDRALDDMQGQSAQFVKAVRRVDRTA